MYRNITIITTLLLLAGSVHLKAQEKATPDRAWLLGTNLAANSCSGDWSERYGFNYSVGVQLGRKWSSNFGISAEWGYLFGGEIPNRLTAIKNLTTSNGEMLNSSGSFAQVNINQRGTYFYLNAEQTFNQFGHNPNSGLNIGLGGGYFWHWLNVDNVGNDSPQLLDQYKLGYDRLGMGFSLKESIGYLHLSQNRLLNFKLCFELSQIWSQDQRAYYYPEGQLSDAIQMNFMYSLKLHWYIPIYLGGKTEEYYFN